MKNLDIRYLSVFMVWQLLFQDVSVDRPYLLTIFRTKYLFCVVQMDGYRRALQQVSVAQSPHNDPAYHFQGHPLHGSVEVKKNLYYLISSTLTKMSLELAKLYALPSFSFEQINFKANFFFVNSLIYFSICASFRARNFAILITWLSNISETGSTRCSSTERLR